MSDDTDDRPKVVELKPSLKDAALRYAAKGKPVFPCKPKIKRPYTQNGWKDATTDPLIINGWWTDHPDAWIGMPTGEITGLIVVDLDLKPGIDGRVSWGDLQSHQGQAPETVEILSPSGGCHLYYRHPGVPIKSTSGMLGPGIDIRGDGGYIICPPSPGYEQEASSQASFAPMPDWLVGLTSKTTPEVPATSQASASLPTQQPVMVSPPRGVGGALPGHRPAGQDRSAVCPGGPAPCGGDGADLCQRPDGQAVPRAAVVCRGADSGRDLPTVRQAQKGEIISCHAAGALCGRW